MARSSEKNQINSVLAVSRVLGGLLWYLHEHYGNLILMTQIQVLLACKGKNVQLLICNLQVHKKQKQEFPSSRNCCGSVM